MGLLSLAMEYYPYVVHPITVLGVGILVLIHYEWDLQAADTPELQRRIGGFLGAGITALLPTAAYFLLTGADPIQATKGNSWQMDALVASGILLAAAITWYLWQRFEWGPLVPNAMQTLAAVTIPYILISPIWNISGHVIVALMPTLYLTLVDRKFWPLLVIPVVMVPNRVFLDAHTWAQSIGGFLLTAIIVAGFYRLQTAGARRPDSRASVD